MLRDSEERMEFRVGPENWSGGIGVLRPGRPFYFAKVNGQAQALPRGSQIFVPVDARAAQALQGLQEHLEYLPDDMKALVWQALRRPSVDARLDRLEAKVLGKTAAEEQEEEDGFGSRFADWFRKPAVRWSALALVLLALLGFGGYRAYRFLTDTPERPAPPPAQTDPAIPDVARRVEGIFRTIEAKKKGSLALTKLANTHQNDLDGANTDRITRRLKVGPSEDLDTLLLVLIKLQILKLDQGAPDTAFLEERHSLNPSMTALARIKPEIFAKDAAAQNLLASMSCRLQAAHPEDPPFLTLSGTGVSGKLCKEFPLKKAIPGLKAIPEFIDEYTADAETPAALQQGN